jgi:hypothetical protein
VIEDDPPASERWKQSGAHVAIGPATDSDLVERAGQNARTLIIAGDLRFQTSAVIEAAAEGARLAGIERLVVCMERAETEILELIRGAGLDHIVLLTGGGRWRRLMRQSVPAGALAEAIDAADDIAGRPRLVLDLTTDGGWAALGLSPP